MIFQGTAIPNLIIEVAGTMIYLFPLIAAYIVSLFVAATVGENHREYRWLFRVLTILAGTGTIALIVAQLTGYTAWTTR